MAEIIFAYTKHIHSLQLVRYSPNTQYKIKVKQALRDTTKHTGGLREGFNGYTDNEKTFTVTLSRI